MESLADWSSRNGSEDEGILAFMRYAREAGGRFYAPDDCKCNTCRIAKILLKHGAVSRTLRDGEYTYKIEKDISSKFELEMWKLSNADTTEV